MSPGTGVLPPAVLWRDTILLWELSQQAWIITTGQPHVGQNNSSNEDASPQHWNEKNLHSIAKHYS